LHNSFVNSNSPENSSVIYQGGALSTQESVYFAVPTIVMPLFADQDFNALQIHSRRRGIRLEVCGLTHEDVGATIQKIIADDT